MFCNLAGLYRQKCQPAAHLSYIISVKDIARAHLLLLMMSGKTFSLGASSRVVDASSKKPAFFVLASSCI